ncbi:MAG: LysE/ArgO family amino acid transporter [Gammaproteobacteria bacterium]|nr:LysE/ArgO family amino acid transporter [Gammaproteobacteria bacterium]
MVFIEGLLVGGGLIVAIGVQNVYMLQQGLARDRVFIIAGIFAISDILLITLGVFGLGAIIQDNTYLLIGLTALGIIFLTLYGLRAAWRAWKASKYLDISRVDNTDDLSMVIITTLALTYLNPHVYLDTLVIFGSLASQLEWQDKWYFTAGGCVASILWFFGLGYGARFLTPLFRSPSVWQFLDIGIAVIMLWLASGLTLYLINLINLL